MLRALTIGRSCFGLRRRLRGQNRVPLPPAMTTAKEFGVFIECRVSGRFSMFRASSTEIKGLYRTQWLLYRSPCMAAASQAARLALILILAGCTFQLSLYLLRWFRHRARVATGAAPRPVDPSEVLARSRAFLRECGAFVMTMTVSLWRRQPPAPARTARRRPVILLHGYSLSAASFWMLTRRLRQDGWNWVWAINHRPLFGNIARNIDTLATAITHVRKVTGIDRVDIIART
jgi:hypothetical protein